MKPPVLNEQTFDVGEKVIVPVWWSECYHQAEIIAPEKWWDLDSKSDCVRVLVEGWRKMWVDRKHVVKSSEQ